MSRLLGGWNINWDAFGAKFGPRNLDQLVLASPPSLPGLPFGTAVDDFSATIDESRQPCPPYLRVVPFGCREDAISPLIDDGDILVFVHQAVNRDNPAEALKQRGWHAEICYKNDAGQAFQKAPWGPCNDSDPSWIIHIFRLELPGIDRDRVVTLKRQVRSWKTIFNDYDFPTDGNPATGGHWFLDPADFASVSDLEDLARRIIRRPEGIKPSVPPVTCVQWAYQVLCLALNVPISPSPGNHKSLWLMIASWELTPFHSCRIPQLRFFRHFSTPICLENRSWHSCGCRVRGSSCTESSKRNDTRECPKRSNPI